jgi:hypothetical protein
MKRIFWYVQVYTREFRAFCIASRITNPNPKTYCQQLKEEALLGDLEEEIDTETLSLVRARTAIY